MNNGTWDFLVDIVPNCVHELRQSMNLSKPMFSSNAHISRGTLEKIECMGQGQPWRGRIRPDQPNKRWQDKGRITNTSAEAIARFVGKKPGEVFGSYDACKARSIPKVKLFANIEERNQAIEKLLPEVDKFIKRAGKPFINILDMDELQDSAYEVLVKVANDAMSRGIPESREFAPYVMKAITYKWRGLCRDKKRISYHFESIINDDGEQREVCDPNEMEAIRHGNIGNQPLREVCINEAYRDLVRELRVVKKLIQELGI